MAPVDDCESSSSAAFHRLGAALQTCCGSERKAASAPQPVVTVVIGTTKLLKDQPDLADRLTKMIQDAYSAVGSKALMLQQQSVLTRLEYGDGSDARGDGNLNTNRVLHIAFLDGVLAGCVSSSKTTTWNAAMGHWGLLVVDLKFRGKGIASALIAAAEARIKEHCGQAQIEYEFKPSNKHSQLLEAMYTKRGYEKVMSFDDVVAGSEFRICHKLFTDAERARVAQSELRTEERALQPSPKQFPDAQRMRSRIIFDALDAFVKAKGTETLKGGPGGVRRIYQFVVLDVLPMAMFVLDLKNGSGSTRDGEDPDAEISISMTDDNMMAWWDKTLMWNDAFWRGQVIMTSTLPPEGGPGNWWSDSVEQLTQLFDAVRQHVDGS